LNQPFNAPPDTRIKRYREMAAEAVRLAGQAISPELSAGFLNVAASWNALADQVEKQAVRTELGGIDLLKGAEGWNRAPHHPGIAAHH
jgi:hypothetical protein